MIKGKSCARSNHSHHDCYNPKILFSALAPQQQHLPDGGVQQQEQHGGEGLPQQQQQHGAVGRPQQQQQQPHQAPQVGPQQQQQPGAGDEGL